MFEETIVVKSAVSAFNNAALFAPMFLWVAVLMLPLFVMVAWFGNDFIARQTMWTGLRDVKNRAFNFALVINVMVFGWLILMGGNYGVLRDATSILSGVVSVLLFAIGMVCIRMLRTINPKMPEFIARRVKKRKRLFLYACLGLVAILAGVQGVHTLWGFVVPAAAVFCGAVAGRGLRRTPNPMIFSAGVMFVVTTIMLMQPEFFRFGQLGNLTIVHLAAVALAGVATAALVAVRVVKPRGKIHHSAFVKLKWMARFVVALAVVLFMLTESVPVFLGMSAAFALMFALSVWHADNVPAHLAMRAWAALMCVFGVITIMPVIAALGIVLWSDLPKDNAISESRFLL